MKTLGNDIYIQRGETWSLDVAIQNERGDPYMIFKALKNPYLAITVSAARYEQRGDFRRTYWLDLDEELVEQADGSTKWIPLKRFTATEALYIPNFSVSEVLAYYGQANGGYIVEDSTSENDIKNFLFFTDPKGDGNRIYKYLSDYGTDINGDGTIDEYDEIWVDYDFRVVNMFNTKDWVEQTYLFDAKILDGETVEEYIINALKEQGDAVNVENEKHWSSEEIQTHINLIKDKEVKALAQEVFLSGAPLMPSYDTKAIILYPTNLYVSANLQGGR
jgi:hypothetical protein